MPPRVPTSPAMHRSSHGNPDCAQWAPHPLRLLVPCLLVFPPLLPCIDHPTEIQTALSGLRTHCVSWSHASSCSHLSCHASIIPRKSRLRSVGSAPTASPGPMPPRVPTSPAMHRSSHGNPDCAQWAPHPLRLLVPCLLVFPPLLPCIDHPTEIQ